jgi:hypothetical protein
MMNRNFLIAVFILLFAVSGLAAPGWYPVSALIGGTTSSLDSLDGQNLFDGDIAIVATTTNTYFYTLDVDSGASEDAVNYTVISPDTNAGDKRWILETVIYDFTSTALADSATPSVANENLFVTGGTTNITALYNGVVGQIITIRAAHGLDFDVTGNARLIGGATTDITVESGDIIQWICVTAGTTTSVWHLISFNDISDDNS